ncbi:hypothetical protein HJB78_18600 [Rhizobium lentis]|uniref:hypothetical protein n=1 Tax=Rhizobium lentis TaxID=1138194 RepID=UPI001C83DA36|nr:hypothetical protein [Rhizobium lentis]MBX5152980.1 hypothetical protein [Rhizobium lentis]
MTDNNMICAGIDVGKSHLDIALHPGRARLRVTYDAAGLKALDAFLQGHDVSRIGFEALNGGCWRICGPAGSRRNCASLPRAVIAVARKLIVLANTILSRKTEWTPQYQQK